MIKNINSMNSCNISISITVEPEMNKKALQTGQNRTVTQVQNIYIISTQQKHNFNPCILKTSTVH